MTLARLTPDHYLRIPWKNGGGVTTVMAQERLPGFAPGDWAGVIWQFGRTAIVAPGPFSDLAGFERLQAVVAGRGLHLDAPGRSIDLSEPFAIARYDGGLKIASRLESGPVEVVNLIARRDLAEIALAALHGGDILEVPAGRHLIHAPAGPVMLAIDGAEARLAKDHTLDLGRGAKVSVVEGVALVASVVPA